MNSNFSVGNVVLFKKVIDSRVDYLIGIIERFDDQHFYVITGEDNSYEYGFRVSLRLLSKEFFTKLDNDRVDVLPKTNWERYLE